LEAEEDGRKAAVKKLTESLKQRVSEINEIYKEQKKILVEKSNEAKAKVKNKIKDNEQLGLAISEVELELRKKETALLEEEKNTIQKTNEVFGNLETLIKGLKPLTIISEEEYEQLVSYGASDFFVAKMGAEAIFEAINSLNLEKMSSELRSEIDEIKGSSTKYVKLTKRLKIIDGLRRAKVNPTWMIIKVLPVLPPDLRPMVQLSGGRFATSDLNDLYRRVINRNNRLKHLITLGAPEIIFEK
jgi:DNA-directed RNA polymerase subunit beta'